MAGNMAAGAVKNFATAVTGADVETREAVDGVVVANRIAGGRVAGSNSSRRCYDGAGGRSVR